MRRTSLLVGVVTGLATFVVGAGVVWAALPTTPSPACPHDFSVAACTLAGGTPMDVQSVSAFTRAINQDHGTNVVITQNKFSDGQSTGWHTHPGPNIVVILSGGFKLYDDKCRETDYGPGDGFATGLETHKADAVGVTTFYSIYFLPKDADVLRTPPAATDTSLTPNCAS
jgi:quercetin dioxygenase-like cupin family protein